MRVLSACCFPTCTLYAGTPQSSRSLGESDGGCWLPGRLGGAVLTLAPPGVSQGASRRLSRPRRRQSIPQMQPRALRPQGRCQLCPPRCPPACPRARPAACPPARPPACLRARPALRNWRQTPRVKGSVPQGGPCLGGPSPGQAITGVSACKPGLHARRPPAATGSVALLEHLPAQELSGSSVGCWFIVEDIQGDESVAR